MAVFASDPEITISEGMAQIHFVISGPLTHFIEENCVKGTDICAKANITVPNNEMIREIRGTDEYDFITEVPLAEPEATEFMFSFWMFDRGDQLNSEACIINIAETKGI